MDLDGFGLRAVKLLGKGTFGRVFLAKTIREKQLVCVKQIIMRNPTEELKMIREEVYIISQLKHPRIINFLQSFVHGKTVNIIMEYAPGGTVRNIINSHQHHPLTVEQLRAYFCDILCGLEYLHIRHVIHRDLKPENILLDENNRIKIADFGISLIHSSHAKKMDAFGTPYYLAPEIFKGERYDFKADIWSLGCVLYEMCTGMSPFRFAVTMSELKAMVLHNSAAHYNCREMRETYGSMWTKLCERMLTYDHHKRITLPDIVRAHPSITLNYYHLYFDYDY